MSPKSDLYFLNAIRAMLGKDPLHQGVDGKDHHMVKGKLKSIEPELEDTLNEELEIHQLMNDRKTS